LALNKINLTCLTHVAVAQNENCITALCTEGPAGSASASLIESHHPGSRVFEVHEYVSILSAFPHDQRPQVSGGLLRAIAREEIALRGMASSPSAVSVVVSSEDTARTIDAFFHAFEFPAYGSPSDWYDAYEGKEYLLQKIIASYQEKVIRIYDIVTQSDLELWSLVVPRTGLREVGEALVALGQVRARMRFIAALPYPQNRLLFSFCFLQGQAAEIRRGLSRHFDTSALACHSQVVALFIHGPHFGDRYGIAHTLVRALEGAGVSLLAIGCTVSSISVIVSEKDLAVAIQTLEATFQKSG
jgi:aspartokinase